MRNKPPSEDVSVPAATTASPPRRKHTAAAAPQIAPVVPPERTETFGDRLRKYRQERGLSLSELASDASVSKGYLSSLENNDHDRRPSAEIMYALASALGVTMSDLMGRKLLPAASPTVPDSLRQFAAEADLSEADLSMLAFIQFRGEQPRTVARWRYIYDSIRNSAQMDEGR